MTIDVYIKYESYINKIARSKAYVIKNIPFVDTEDVFMEGVVGLTEAVNHIEKSEGILNKDAYIKRCILNAINKYISNCIKKSKPYDALTNTKYNLPDILFVDEFTKLLYDGCSYRDIAKKLNISVYAVEKRINNLRMEYNNEE